MTTVYKFKAYYTDAGVGAVQDPAPTCTVINMADDSKLADAQATTASTNMPGLYSYEYSGADGLDCVAWFKTTDTGCDVKELASYVSEKITTNLNADVAGVEAKVDTIDTVIDNIHDTDLPAVKSDTGAIKNKTDNLPASPANESTLSTMNGKIDTIDDYLDTEITAIINHLTGIKGVGWTNETLVALKNYVDELETRLTSARAGYLDKLNVTGTLANSSDANTYKANVSGLATTLHVQEIENKVDAIRDDTNTTGVLLRDDAITAIFDDANVVGSYTFRQVLKILAAALAGKASGGGTTSITFRGVDDASNVIVATVDSNGNRSAVTLTV